MPPISSPLSSDSAGALPAAGPAGTHAGQPETFRGPLAVGRRRFLAGSAALAGLVALPRTLRAEGGAVPVDGEPFSFDRLTEAARLRAQSPDTDPPEPDPVLATLDYDAYQKIAFRPDHAVWASDSPGWQLLPFHTGWLFDRPVRLHEVVDGIAVALEFTAADFEYRGDLAEKIPADFVLPGVAGFKLTHPLNRADLQDEVAAFLGASYFRALGQGNRYGLSARGLALDSGLPQPEEFPRFSEFWLARPTPGDDSLTLWASLDSARLTGAVQIIIRPGPVTVFEVTNRLFFRAAVDELGVAPLTSMFMFGGINRARFDDYRPQVHDSDGLRIIRADGDVIWRALSNPAELASSYFTETRPQRFGLHQRSRAFEDFEDPFARYDLRPSLDVEPIGDWGTGAVRLFEIPTNLEIHDNVGAFWVPGHRPAAGEAFEIAYRLHWGALSPDTGTDLAWVADTFSGVGGAAGLENPPDTRKFVVDFAGGLLSRTPEPIPDPATGEIANPEIGPVVTVSGGSAEIVTLSRLPGDERWRLTMDIAAERGATVEINAHIAGFGRKLSEIWSFQWRKA